jgi:hypothetical protein
MSKGNVKLAWALVDGQLAHISDFRAAPHGLRPLAQCEACGASLTMRLGTTNAHHYAHRSTARCPLTAPETARHYNSKHALATKLKSAEVLCVVAKCSYSRGSVSCSEDLTAVAAEGWDEVLVESFIDPVRPDIVLLRGGVPALAIEVRATHAISETKAVRLADLLLPWIEVNAGPDCDEWLPASVMRVLRLESHLAAKLCDTHLAVTSDESLVAQDGLSAAAVALASNRSIPSLKPDLPRHGERWMFRVVDCHPAQGPRVRKVFWAYSRKSGATFRLRLVDAVSSAVVAELRNVPKSERALRDLHQRLIEHVACSYERWSSPLPWLDAAAFPLRGTTVYRKDYMPVRYVRDSNGAWTKVD